MSQDGLRPLLHGALVLVGHSGNSNNGDNGDNGGDGDGNARGYIAEVEQYTMPIK